MLMLVHCIRVGGLRNYRHRKEEKAAEWEETRDLAHIRVLRHERRGKNKGAGWKDNCE